MSNDSDSAKQKGNLLEDIVALLHKMPAASVQTRVKINAQEPGQASDRGREIDVLVSHYVAGSPVRIAIECKNEKEVVGIGYIDSFFGKLADIGIPASQGIFVSPIGFTSGAIARAAVVGMRLLVLDGLDESRLAAELNAALLKMVHYVLFVETISFFSFLPSDAPGEPWPEGVELAGHTVHDHIWRRWITGGLPTTLGEHYLSFRSNTGGAVVECRIVAYAGSICGIAKQFSLRDAASSELERLRLETEFKIPNTVDLHVINNDEDLAAFESAISSSEVGLVVHKLRVPRIVAGAVFWPPSREAIQRVVELRNSGCEVSFANVEGRDLSRAWAMFETRRLDEADVAAHSET